MEPSPTSFDTIYTQFHNDLRQFIRRRVSDEAAADDLLQEIFLKIHARIGTLKDSSKVTSWIFQVTRNSIIDYYRSQKPTQPLEESHHPIEEQEEEEDAMERLSPSIRKFINQLPEPYREAILLTEYGGLSQKALSEKLGLSFSGAKSRVQRGRAMLKDLLLQCCHFEFDLYGNVSDYHQITCCCTKNHRK